jgi:hypothetical protein
MREFSHLAGPLSSLDVDTPAHHNISPLPDKQLVLELEFREAGLEVVDGLPGSFRLVQTRPLNEDQPGAATELRLENAFWCQ